jgi:2-succinyl-5-enolpyruvyl-6-hydroxy-3-cyclohexene-1-carboxylate synthase
MTPETTTNQLWCRAIVDALLGRGLCSAVVAPGSRSAPLALALAERAGPSLRIHVVVDERSAAFFALGLAKGARAPVLLLCTSGSAGAHALPAVIEAQATCTPLLVVTADRPPELHGFGAHQTVEQTRLFGVHAHFVDLGTASDAPAALAHLRALAAQAMRRDAGVVHWNAPFREPLAPPRDAASWQNAGVAGAVAPAPHLHAPELRAPKDVVARVAAALASAQRPLFMVGPLDAHDAGGVRTPLLRLARRLGAPVLAELASSLRGEADRDVGVPDVDSPDADLLDVVVSHAELIVRAGHAPAPDLVVRLGMTPTTRALLACADACPHTIAVTEGPVCDPNHAAHENVVAAASAFLDDVAAALPVQRQGALASFHSDDMARPRREDGSTWLAQWRTLDTCAASALSRALADGPLDEPAVASSTVRAVRAGSVLVLASSMPIRDAEAFGGVPAAGVRVVVNRGACGIDGLVSTAAGVARATGRETTLLCGDLALLHDIGGLVTARMAARDGARLRIVVINNDGGGIFSLLPVAERADADVFSQLFVAPHGLTFASAAAFAGATYASVDARHGTARDTDALARALDNARPPVSGGLAIVEVKTDGNAVRAGQERVLRRVSAALASRPLPSTEGPR